MPRQKVDSARCPQCQAQSKIVVQQVIDAQDLVMKSAFLQRRVHSVPCPACNTTLLAAVPTLYYDSEKQLALVFAPADVHLAAPAQEQVIAELTALMIESRPADQQSAPLPSPQRCASLDAMVDAVLAADGVDPEALKIQAAQAKLIETLLQSSGEDELRERASAHEDELDADFFELLTAYMQAAQMRGDTQGAQTFLTLRTLLGQWVPHGTHMIAAIDARLGLVAIQSREELLERLRAAQSQAERAELVASGHFLLDQSFFALVNAAVSQAISIGDSASVKQLKLLSANIAELKRNQEAKSQAAMQRAAGLFQAVVQSDTPDQVLRRRLDEVDEAFFMLLGANIERARRQGQSEPARALELIGQLARTFQQQSQPA